MIIERTRVCQSGEQWDMIALKELGNTAYAPELMCANPHAGDVLVFSGGEVINIPLIHAGEETDTAPWRQ